MGNIGYMLGTFPGLTETFVLREIQSLRERGFDVIVFAVRRSKYPHVERSLLVNGMSNHVVYARPDSLLRHLIRNITSFLRHPSQYLGALRLFLGAIPEVNPAWAIRLLYHFYCGIGFITDLKKWKIDHLHAHFTTGCNVALAVHLYGGTPFSFTAHASGDIFRRPILLKEKVDCAIFIIPVCEYSRSYLDAVTLFSNSPKLHCIYNGIDLGEASRMLGGAQTRALSCQREAGDGRSGRIVSVGSLVGVKGHPTLIEACKRLRESGWSVTCEIIGEGPERPVLEKLIAEADLGQEIRLLGAVPLSKVYETLAHADIFVLLAEIGIDGYRDGLPTAILEAMVMGLPVVSTWLSGIPEMVENEVTGILVPERNSHLAAKAIERLLVDRAMGRAMGEAGRERAARVFDFRRLADRRADLFARYVS